MQSKYVKLFYGWNELKIKIHLGRRIRIDPEQKRDMVC